jgi:hypothetical protein
VVGPLLLLLSKYSEIVWSPGASAQVSGKMMRHLPQYFRIVTLLTHGTSFLMT